MGSRLSLDLDQYITDDWYTDSQKWFTDQRVIAEKGDKKRLMVRWFFIASNSMEHNVVLIHTQDKKSQKTTRVLWSDGVIKFRGKTSKSQFSISIGKDLVIVSIEFSKCSGNYQYSLTINGVLYEKKCPTAPKYAEQFFSTSVKQYVAPKESKKQSVEHKIHIGTMTNKTLRHRQEVATHGFVRMECLIPLENTPEVLINLVLLYYSVSDEWDTEMSDNRLVLDDTQFILSKAVNDLSIVRYYAFGMDHCERGQRRLWKFKITETDQRYSRLSLSIGVIKTSLISTESFDRIYEHNR